MLETYLAWIFQIIMLKEIETRIKMKNRKNENDIRFTWFGSMSTSMRVKLVILLLILMIKHTCLQVSYLYVTSMAMHVPLSTLTSIVALTYKTYTTNLHHNKYVPQEIKLKSLVHPWVKVAIYIVDQGPPCYTTVSFFFCRVVNNAYFFQCS